jgi:molecular chaperone GrpE (heat shock protein)
MKVDEKTTDVSFENQKEAAKDVVSQPALSEEEYSHMAGVNARIRDLKQYGYDLREHLDGMKSELARLEEILENTRTELEQKTQEMQDCFDNYILKPYGLTGEIVIADTVPHYITVKSPEQVSG